MARRARSFERQLSSVLDQLGEVPYSGQWEAALSEAADFVGCQAIDLTHIHNSTGQVARWDFTRMDVAEAQRYMNDYINADVLSVHPRQAHIIRLREGQFFADSDAWSPTERGRMPFFVDLYKPTMFEEDVASCVRTGDSGRTRVIFGCHYTRRADAHEREAQSRMRLLLPHIRRACAAEDKLRTVLSEKLALEHALERVDQAVAMLDATGRVVHFNVAAEEIFRGARGLGLAPDRRLILGSSEARSALSKALALCENPLIMTRDGAGQAAEIAVPAAEGQFLILNVQGLPKQLLGAFGAVALVFIGDPNGKARDRGASLRTTYRLTEAEAELTQALLAGETLKRYANRRELSYETVRSQLRRIFAKTGARRQADLVRLAERLNTPRNAAT
jgi:DNA-binding CsgD family transcriptional regulator